MLSNNMDEVLALIDELQIYDAGAHPPNPCVCLLVLEYWD